jgi:hypothetical protein
MIRLRIKLRRDKMAECRLIPHRLSKRSDDPGLSGRWGASSDLSYLSCFLILPVSSGLKRPVEFYGTGSRAVIRAATAVPAFIRVKNNGRFSLFGVGNINIYLANLNAVITPVAYFRVKNDRLVWRDNIRHGHEFSLRHFYLRYRSDIELLSNLCSSLLEERVQGFIRRRPSTGSGLRRDKRVRV